MKKLLLILVLFVTTISYGQLDSTQYVTNSNVEKLVDKYSQKVEAAFISIAENLQQPVERVYKLIIKQQIIKGWSSILLLVVSSIIVYWGIMLGKKDHYNDGPWLFPVVFGGFATLGAIIWIFISGFSCLINPEYMALKEIINMIR